MVVKNNIRIGFDISQTGSNKAGCGYFAHSLLNAALSNLVSFDWHLFPHFGDFFYDGLMPLSNPYLKGDYGPIINTRIQVEKFWNAPYLDLICHSTPYVKKFLINPDGKKNELSVWPVRYFYV